VVKDQLNHSIKVSYSLKVVEPFKVKPRTVSFSPPFFEKEGYGRFY